MQLQFHGAVRTVTGSQHLLTVNGHRILLDCGFYQGRRQETYARNLHLPYDAARVDVLVLSHAHIDHSGNVPNLVKRGFRGDIFATFATRDLCSIMLRDSAKIMANDVRYLNKQRGRKGEAPVEPIYGDEDAIAAMRQFLAMSYDRTREIAPGVNLTFVDAGHILGSAIVILDIEDREQGRERRLVFSGDIGRPKRPILRDPALVDHADILLIESTYGNRTHKNEAESDDELRDVIRATMQRGGKVIVPAFAVGRTQELVYRIHRLINERQLPNTLPIFVDSPLAIDATGIYRMHPESFDEETYEFMLNVRTGDPFGFDRMIYTRAVEQSKSLNELQGPAVIISASGMAESGRILHHLKNNVEDPRNTVLIVGWQAEHTLGRRIAERARQVSIFGERYDLRAQVATINGFSAHADRPELLEWAGHIKTPPRHTFVVHGEEAPALSLADALREQGHRKVTVPQLGEKFTL